MCSGFLGLKARHLFLNGSCGWLQRERKERPAAREPVKGKRCQEPRNLQVLNLRSLEQIPLFLGSTVVDRRPRRPKKSQNVFPEVKDLEISLSVTYDPYAPPWSLPWRWGHKGSLVTRKPGNLCDQGVTQQVTRHVVLAISAPIFSMARWRTTCPGHAEGGFKRWHRRRYFLYFLFVTPPAVTSWYPLQVTGAIAHDDRKL